MNTLKRIAYWLASTEGETFMWYVILAACLCALVSLMGGGR